MSLELKLNPCIYKGILKICFSHYQSCCDHLYRVCKKIHVFNDCYLLVVNFDVVGHENTGVGQNIENRNNFLEHPVHAYAMVVKNF